ENARIIFICQGNKFAQVVLVEDIAQWVKGIGQQNRSGAISKGVLNSFKVYPWLLTGLHITIRWCYADIDALTTCGLRQFQKWWVGRKRDNHGGIRAREVLDAE